MQLSNEDMQQIRGVFTDMLNGFKSDMLAELRQEFAAQPPKPAEPPPPPEHFTAQPPQPAEPPPPPPVEYFSGLEKSISDQTGTLQQISGLLAGLGQKFDTLQNAIDHIPAPGSFRDEATGGNSSGGNFI